MKKKVKIALGYQVELMSNSLFYKLTKTFVNDGYEVITVGIKRIKDKSASTLSQISVLELSNTKYIEIHARMHYASGVKNFVGILKYQLSTIQELLKKANKADTYYAIDLLMGVPFFIISLLKRKPFIYHIADKFIDSYKVPKFLKPIFSLIDLLLISKAKLIIVPHEDRIDKVLRKYKDKIIVVYNTPEDINGTYDQEADLSEKSRNKRLKIAYFGVLTEDRFIKQLCNVVSQDTRLELEIGGYGPLEDFVRSESYKCDRIYFHGKVPYDLVLQIQKKSDLLIAMYDPSIKNNRKSSPNKLYEAMMLGKPIIVAKGMGIDDFVSKAGIGFVSEYSVENFIKTIEKILQSDKKEIQICGLNGRKLYEEKYRWDLMSKKIIQAIEKLFD